MAEQNNSKSGEAGDVTFDADSTLAGSGPASVEFEADDTLGGDAKPSPAQALKDEAAKFGNQAADRMRALASENKDRATGALDEVVRMFQTAADEVESRIGADYGQYARNAANGIAGFNDALRSKEVDDLFDDAAAFVRKSPVVAVGTAAAVGFVLARVIKSGFDAAADRSDRPTDPV